MDLNHLKINFLGDSITSGQRSTQPELCYVGRFQQAYPEAVIRNYGVPGSCISNQCLWGVEDFHARAERMDLDADLVVVFGGTNDYCCCCPPGQWGDRTQDTFYGACWVLFEKLLQKYHGKWIVVATPLHRFEEDGTICEERQMIAPLETYAQAIKETAAYFAFPVIDLFATSGIQPHFDIIRETYMPDGLHPNDAGHELLFQRMDAALRHIL